MPTRHENTYLSSRSSQLTYTDLWLSLAPFLPFKTLLHFPWNSDSVLVSIHWYKRLNNVFFDCQICWVNFCFDIIQLLQDCLEGNLYVILIETTYISICICFFSKAFHTETPLKPQKNHMQNGIASLNSQRDWKNLSIFNCSHMWKLYNNVGFIVVAMLIAFGSSLSFYHPVLLYKSCDLLLPNPKVFILYIP